MLNVTPDDVRRTLSRDETVSELLTLRDQAEALMKAVGEGISEEPPFSGTMEEKQEYNRLSAPRNYVRSVKNNINVLRLYLNSSRFEDAEKKQTELAKNIIDGQEKFIAHAGITALLARVDIALTNITFSNLKPAAQAQEQTEPVSNTPELDMNNPFDRIQYAAIKLREDIAQRGSVAQTDEEKQYLTRLSTGLDSWIGARRDEQSNAGFSQTLADLKTLLIEQKDHAELAARMPNFFKVLNAAYIEWTGQDELSLASAAESSAQAETVLIEQKVTVETTVSHLPKIDYTPVQKPENTPQEHPATSEARTVFLDNVDTLAQSLQDGALSQTSVAEEIAAESQPEFIQTVSHEALDKAVLAYQGQIGMLYSQTNMLLETLRSYGHDTPEMDAMVNLLADGHDQYQIFLDGSENYDLSAHQNILAYWTTLQDEFKNIFREPIEYIKDNIDELTNPETNADVQSLESMLDAIEVSQPGLLVKMNQASPLVETAITKAQPVLAAYFETKKKKDKAAADKAAHEIVQYVRNHPEGFLIATALENDLMTGGKNQSTKSETGKPLNALIKNLLALSGSTDQRSALRAELELLTLAPEAIASRNAEIAQLDLKIAQLEGQRDSAAHGLLIRGEAIVEARNAAEAAHQATLDAELLSALTESLENDGFLRDTTATADEAATPEQITATEAETQPGQDAPAFAEPQHESFEVKPQSRPSNVSNGADIHPRDLDEPVSNDLFAAMMATRARRPLGDDLQRDLGDAMPRRDDVLPRSPQLVLRKPFEVSEADDGAPIPAFLRRTGNTYEEPIIDRTHRIGDRIGSKMSGAYLVGAGSARATVTFAAAFIRQAKDRWPTMLIGAGTGYFVKGALIGSASVTLGPVLAAAAFGAVIGAVVTEPLGRHYQARMANAPKRQDTALWKHMANQGKGAFVASLKTVRDLGNVTSGRDNSLINLGATLLFTPELLIQSYQAVRMQEKASGTKLSIWQRAGAMGAAFKEIDPRAYRALGAMAAGSVGGAIGAGINHFYGEQIHETFNNLRGKLFGAAAIQDQLQNSGMPVTAPAEDVPPVVVAENPPKILDRVPMAPEDTAPRILPDQPVTAPLTAPAITAVPPVSPEVATDQALPQTAPEAPAVVADHPATATPLADITTNTGKIIAFLHDNTAFSEMKTQVRTLIDNGTLKGRNATLFTKLIERSEAGSFTALNDLRANISQGGIVHANGSVTHLRGMAANEALGQRMMQSVHDTLKPEMFTDRGFKAALHMNNEHLGNPDKFIHRAQPAARPAPATRPTVHRAAPVATPVANPAASTAFPTHSSFAEYELNLPKPATALAFNNPFEEIGNKLKSIFQPTAAAPVVEAPPAVSPGIRNAAAFVHDAAVAPRGPYTEATFRILQTQAEAGDPQSLNALKKWAEYVAARENTLPPAQERQIIRGIKPSTPRV